VIVKETKRGIEAVKPLHNGRLHFFVRNSYGRFLVDIHYDSSEHLELVKSCQLFPTLTARRMLHPETFTAKENDEIREFVNDYIKPNLRNFPMVIEKVERKGIF